MAVAAPAGADSSRSMEYDKKTATEGLPLPPQAASDMLHDPAAAATFARSLPDQSWSSCDLDTTVSSDINREF